MKQKYIKLNKLGQGTYGTVYQAKHIETGTLVAIKKIKFDEQDQGIPATALRQIAILKRLNHINIVKLLQVLYQAQNRKLYLIFQYIQEDLHKHCKRRRVSYLQVKSYAYQMLKGLQYLHANMVMHRDLKPHNILVTQGGIIKIADFGLSRIFQLPIGTLSHEIQTLWYRAPQLILGSPKYSLAIDIWSLGCIFFQICQGYPLFQSDSQVDLIHKIFMLYGTPNISQWPQMVNMPNYRSDFPRFKAKGKQLSNLDIQGQRLIMSMTCLNPNKRITVRKALQHQFFEGIHLPFY